MPPANSPWQSPPAGGADGLELELDVEVEVDVDADVDDNENIRFMRSTLAALDREPSDPELPQLRSRNRTHVDSQRDPRARRSHNPAPPPPADESSEDRRVRLQQILARLNRLHDPAAYSNRNPRASTLYDWAPPEEPSAASASAASASASAAAPDDAELDHILAEPDILRVLSQSQLDSSRQRDAAPTSEGIDAGARRRRREFDWVSLRSRAVLQRAREGRLEAVSPSATERMLSYAMSRSERSGLSEEEERARNLGWYTRPGEQHNSSIASRNDSGNISREELRARTLLERNAASRRSHTDAPRLPISTPPVVSASTPPGSSQLLESALKYLNQLRSCNRYEDALSAAIEYGLATKEFFADKHDDFVMDLAEVHPLAESSWLQPGTSFEGEQHATSSNPALLHSRSSAQARSVEQINPNYRTQSATTTEPAFDHPPGSTRVVPFDATRPWLSHQFTPPVATTNLTRSAKPASTSHDHWPVRVVIHAVDAEKMTLQGTMEAYDVPQHPASVSILNSAERPKAGRKNAPITTYLEGHIIDLATHSFLTPSAAEAKLHGPHPTTADNATPYTSLSGAITFPAATPGTDAANWRKLPPFNTLSSDSEAARLMLSKDRINEVNESYIFMRWKERCFVHGKDDKCSAEDRSGDRCCGHGLTISGFYYVSLRRSDGEVEGLYFDPSSTPYQCLRLEGMSGRRGWASCELR